MEDALPKLRSNYQLQNSVPQEKNNPHLVQAQPKNNDFHKNQPIGSYQVVFKIKMFYR